MGEGALSPRKGGKLAAQAPLSWRGPPLRAQRPLEDLFLDAGGESESEESEAEDTYQKPEATIEL